MRMMEQARALVTRRLERIEQAARAIPGLRVERRGEVLTMRAPRRRWSPARVG